jgi:hypothetical protein
MFPDDVSGSRDVKGNAPAAVLVAGSDVEALDRW